MPLECRYLNILESNLKESISIFTGAGFSRLAKNINNEPLPLGEEIYKKLIEKFSVKHKPNNLAALCNFLQTSHKDELKNYFEQIFTVKNYDPLYDELNKLNIQNWFSTNIDDLPYKINFSQKYLNNVYVNSFQLDNSAVNYLPLHGSIFSKDQRKYIFSSIDLTHNTKNEDFNILKNKILEKHIFFLGYSFEDLLAWNAINDLNQNISTVQHKNKWVLLTDFDQEIETFFSTLGFKTIYGYINDFLTFIKNTFDEKNLIHNTNELDISLEKFSITNKIKLSPTKPINEFFLGFPASINNIINGSIPKLSSFQKILDLSYENKHIITTGLFFSGKTTVAMQLAHYLHSTNKNKHVLFFEDPPTEEHVELLIKTLINSNKNYIIIVDNFCNRYNAIEKLLNQNPNQIQILAFDRFYIFDSIRYKFNKPNIEEIELVDLEDSDVNLIWNNIPENLKVTEKPSKKFTVFEMILSSINQHEQLSKKVKDLLISIQKQNKDLLLLLLMSAYFERCRTPISMDVLIMFFSPKYDYKGIYQLIKSLKDLLVEKNISQYIDLDRQQDYFSIRSPIFGETVIKNVNKTEFQLFLSDFTKRVGTIFIPNYDIFKKYAYDSHLIKTIFDKTQQNDTLSTENYNKGIEFYNEVLKYDEKNLFTFQHMAIFSSYHHQFENAFIFIEKAQNLSKNIVFSTKHIYATILFSANFIKIEKETNIPLEIEDQLYQSMEILESCINSSNAKLYHTFSYTEQAIKLANLNNKYNKFLETALTYLKKKQKSLPNFQKRDSKKINLLISEVEKSLEYNRN